MRHGKVTFTATWDTSLKSAGGPKQVEASLAVRQKEKLATFLEIKQK